MDLSKIIVPADLEVPKPLVTCVIEGHLDEGDLRELALSAPDPTGPIEDDDPSDLKKVREKHHSVARMIAGGLSQRMVSQLCGYTESYLSVLLNNPSMQELVELYRIQHGSAANVITEKLRTVGLKAVESLESDLEAGNLSKQEKLGLAKLGLDRGGHGPTSHQHVVQENHLFDHAELQRRNNEARARNAKHIVPSAEVRAALMPPVRAEGPADTEGEQEIEADRTVGEETSYLVEHRQLERLPEHRE